MTTQIYVPNLLFVLESFHNKLVRTCHLAKTYIKEKKEKSKIYSCTPLPIMGVTTLESRRGHTSRGERPSPKIHSVVFVYLTKKPSCMKRQIRFLFRRHRSLKIKPKSTAATTYPQHSFHHGGKPKRSGDICEVN